MTCQNIMKSCEALGISPSQGSARVWKSLESVKFKEFQTQVLQVLLKMVKHSSTLGQPVPNLHGKPWFPVFELVWISPVQISGLQLLTLTLASQWTKCFHIHSAKCKTQFGSHKNRSTTTTHAHFHPCDKQPEWVWGSSFGPFEGSGLNRGIVREPSQGGGTLTGGGGWVWGKVWRETFFQ